ncbi:protein OBERON 3 [Sesamum alatum]|uniref:Protein OBERON 3 n=1 Tax=Sesamum alatum TaxID=300844 RepID=A0AAE2CIF4_9LAMI|nr:protein OBERON 3 [Sesamum alatum]
MVREREDSDELSGEKNRESPDEKMEFQERGIDFLGEKSPDKIEVIGGFDERAALQPKRAGNFGSQELTLSYLCDNSKLGFAEKDVSGQNLLNSLDKLSGRYKGKEIVVSEDQNEENNNKVWVERDFLQLNENRGNSCKREAENVEIEGENKEKKPKVESLNLSLALPDVSLSLAGSNRVQNVDLPSRLRPSRSVQSLGPSCNNTQTTYSNDFTAASLSYSYSHPFSHNPSCSLTRNSTENYDYSVGSHRRECDQIWNCGEGTNGSVHSRFRPIGDGTVALSNHGGGGGFGMGNRSGFSKDSCNNSFYRTTSSDNVSFFPSELPARPRMDAQSGDSRMRNLENLRDSEDHVVKARKPSRPERILREIVSESVPAMAQIIQELTDETIESTKEYLKNIIDNPERRDELVGLQKRLERRSDLTNETLSKCQKSQLEILVAIKMGLVSFIHGKNKLPAAELVDIFVLERCRNINCRRLLPVDDCDCKICSTKKGFCSECMCPVCLNFDCANNTCSWVGCDTCSHWCHAACGLERNLIKPGPCLKGSSGATEMQFHCLGCGHASEMFGFVKDVFISCAKDWGLENLIKELDCVRKIFRGSEDRIGKHLNMKADEMLSKLQNKMITPPEVCNSMFQFFNSTENFVHMGSSSMLSKDSIDQPSFGKDVSALPLSNSLTPKLSFYNMNSSSGRQESTPFDLHHNDIKVPIMGDKIIEDEWSVKPVKKDGFDSLESLVRIKEAEARMFQSRADEARREIESYRRMVRMKTEKLEEEYAAKLAKLCLQETEERRRKKLDELKALENSHCDYYKMKIRMQSEISGLLKRMEATKQQLV